MRCDSLFDTAKLMRGLDAKAAELGVGRGDLVAVGTLAVLNAPSDRLREVFARIEVRPMSPGR